MCARETFPTVELLNRKPQRETEWPSERLSGGHPSDPSEHKKRLRGAISLQPQRFPQTPQTPQLFFKLRWKEENGVFGKYQKIPGIMGGVIRDEKKGGLYMVGNVSEW